MGAEFAPEANRAIVHAPYVVALQICQLFDDFELEVPCQVADPMNNPSIACPVFDSRHIP